MPEEVSEIYLCGITPKRPFLREQGVEVDVWIDDWPEAIVEDVYTM